MQCTWSPTSPAHALIHRASFATSLPFRKAGKSIPSRKAIAAKTPPIQSPRGAGSKLVQRQPPAPIAPPGRKPGFIRRHGWRILRWCAVATLAWDFYNIRSYTRHHDTVPISGRKRYGGSSLVNRLWEKEVEEVQRMQDSAPEAVHLPHTLEAALSIERVGTVLKNVAAAAGIDTARFKIRYDPGSGPPKAAVNAAGEVFINKAMMVAAPSDSKLAFVLGHEVGHYLVEHVKESVQLDIFLSRLSVPLLPVVIPGAALLTFGASFADGLFFLVPEALMLLVPGALMCSPVVAAVMYSRHTSRKREYEADLIGLYLMPDAGYDTGAAPAMMEMIGDFEERMMAELKKRNPRASRNPWHETHPPVRDRVSRLRETMPYVRKAIAQQKGQQSQPSHVGKRDVTRQHIDRWNDFVRQRERKQLERQPVTWLSSDG